MRSAGDDGFADGQSQSSEAADAAFDPGIEIGYLRRASRDHDLDPELGAHPFDPGAGAGYDDRRARKEAKRRAREERARRERERKAREARERSMRASQIAEARSRTTGAGTAEAAAAEREPVELDEPAEVGAGEPASVTELRGLRPQRRSLAKRLGRERAARERQERERRARVERERIERERAERVRQERRRREREEHLRRDRQVLRKQERGRRHPPAPAKAAPTVVSSKAAPVLAPSPEPIPATVPAAPAALPQRRPPIPRPVLVPRRPRTVRRRDLVWPTAKAGIAVTIVLAMTAGLGSLLGLPVPGLNPSTSQGSLVSSATLFGVGPGTAPGLSGGYVFPVGGPAPHDYGEAAAKFGADRYGHIHQGQDVFAKPGTPLLAVRDGIVLDGGGGKSFYAYGGGETLVMYSPADDRSYVYLHMLKPSQLRAGDEVRAGQVVGQVGCTGSCYGPHLHFEIRRGKVAYGHEGKPIDPLPYLRQWEQLGAR
jgi:murein DD-endopeptidase MepM/ murein hydrolase activator NlpD